MDRIGEKSSSVISGDLTISMIMANDRQSMISYSCLIVTIVICLRFMDILTT